MGLAGVTVDIEAHQRTEDLNGFNFFAVHVYLPPLVVGNGSHNQLVLPGSGEAAVEGAFGVLGDLVLILRQLCHDVLKNFPVNIIEGCVVGFDVESFGLVFHIQVKLGALFLQTERGDASSFVAVEASVGDSSAVHAVAEGHFKFTGIV